ISMILNIFKRQREPLAIVGALVFGYVVLVALIMFNVEPNTFKTFGDAIYWSVISLTTIGYGDIFAQSGLGKCITVVSALMGVAIFALPAGIITAGYMEELNREKNYKLIAFDMDGTLLNSEKELTEPTIEALKKAADEGKEIAIATGRSLTGVLPYIDQLPMVHFGILSSATIIYDFWEDKVISMDNIAWDQIYDIADAAEQEDIMLLMMSEGVGLLDKSKIDHLAEYHMEQYEKLYRENATLVENPLEMLRNANRKYEKINLYHTSQKARLRTRHRLEHLPLELVDSEETALEITPLGSSKGTGLRMVCRYLDIPMKQTIAVGDADNDLSIIETAGMGIAMKNANKKVKEAAQAVVGDNDHDGCAQAIEKYLLGD
ncbi:MAG: Cof-type HAD-IIB family hydrolase, partial [Lachnospiraceae bacterium]|nr:Cof-type HAD-IIB family hydrolase [Lachnospiraceae bacterium]